MQGTRLEVTANLAHLRQPEARILTQARKLTFFE